MNSAYSNVLVMTWISLNPSATTSASAMIEITSHLPQTVTDQRFDYAYQALGAHFAGFPSDRLVSTSRMFPGHMRADVQAGIDKLFSASPLRFFGIHEEQRYETLNFAALTRDGRNAHRSLPRRADLANGSCHAHACALSVSRDALQFHGAA